MARSRLMCVPVLLGTLGLVAIGCGGSTFNGSGSGGSAGASGGSGATGGSGGSGGTGGSAGGGAGGSGGGPCVTNADCAHNGLCGYPMKDGCAAKGTCFPLPGVVCNAFSPGCACDGSTINVICTGLPGGYASAPLLHPGQCSDAGSGKSFPCGSNLSCDSATQYCKIGEGGPCCAPPSYSCESIPASCSKDHTCACIKTAVGAQQCTESGGGVTVTFQYP